MRYITIERRRSCPSRWRMSWFDKTLTITTPWVLVFVGKWS